MLGSCFCVLIHRATILAKPLPDLPSCSFTALLTAHFTLFTLDPPQTICSCNPSSVSLRIPLQTLLFRTPTNAALRWASEFLHFPPFSPCFGRVSFIFCRFFPTFFLAFLHFPPFSPCFQRFSFVFFLPFSCHSSMFLHFPPVFNDVPSFSFFFPPFFLPESTDLGGIEAYRHLFA